ncbi:MAG: hypothetical protein ACXVIO_01110, partial [Candidatus Angelobacter sp.]
WLRGVDLNSVPALILCKLLILQYAKLAKTAKKANLSYNFPTLSMKPDSRPVAIKASSRFVCTLKRFEPIKIFCSLQGPNE